MKNVNSVSASLKQQYLFTEDRKPAKIHRKDRQINAQGIKFGWSARVNGFISNIDVYYKLD